MAALTPPLGKKPQTRSPRPKARRIPEREHPETTWAPGRAGIDRRLSLFDFQRMDRRASIEPPPDIRSELERWIQKRSQQSAGTRQAV